MVDVTICPPRHAEGISRVTAKCNNPTRPLPKALHRTTATDIHLHKVDIYWFTYTILNPKNLDRLDVVSSQAFLKLLEAHDG